MYTQLHCIDSLCKSIDDVVSKNRHVSLFDEDEILKKCSKKLRRLKTDIIKSGKIESSHKIRLVKIIALLDEFFGLDGMILQQFDELK